MTNPYGLDALSTRLVALTKDLVLFPSTISWPDELERCYQFVKNHVDSDENIRVREYRVSGFPSLVALPERIDTPEVLFCAHLDVVTQPHEEAYRASIRDGRIYGPGAGDMKGQLAILLELFRDTHRRHPGISLGLAITSDEEIGGENGIRYLVEEAGLRCGLAMIPDGGSLNEITVEEKGAVHVEVNERGHAGHGARPWLADNPLDRLLERLAGVRAHFESFEKTDEMWCPTCALTILGAANDTPNRIPGSARAVLDVRFPPPHTIDSMLSEVREALGGDLELKTGMAAEPIHLSPDPLFQTVTEEITGRPTRLVREAGASDARYFCRRGTPVIMSRPSLGNIHSEDEWIDIQSMATFYRVYERYLTRKLVKGGA